jgi:hypothetical protein
MSSAAVRSTFRSVCNSSYEEKLREDELRRHHERLESIRNKHSSLHECEGEEERLKNMKKLQRLKGATSLKSLRELIKLENRAIVERICKINNRKSEHAQAEAKSLFTSRKEKDRMEQRQLKKGNELLVERIMKEWEKLATKKSIKESFKEYELLRSKLRKVHKEG